MKRIYSVLIVGAWMTSAALAADEKSVPAPQTVPAAEPQAASSIYIELANLFFDPEEMDAGEIEDWIWLF